MEIILKANDQTHTIQASDEIDIHEWFTILESLTIAMTYDHEQWQNKIIDLSEEFIIKNDDL